MSNTSNKPHFLPFLLDGASWMVEKRQSNTSNSVQQDNAIVVYIYMIK